jgi:hypothetical protein
MVTLIKNLDKSSLSVELPAFVAAMLIAETLFKFHSFTFECLAFLTTWGILSQVFGKAKEVIQGAK